MLWPVLARLFGKRFDWLQVEATSHCNAACIYCPRTVYRHAWQSRHLSLDTFRKLLPELPRARLVHLQGWGEPFLNPDLFAMLSLAKQQGCQVSLTTNGMLLDEDKIQALMESGLDVLAFSLAGLAENHNRVRQGTDYGTVLRNIRAVHDAKQRHRSPRPILHLAYMVLRSGLADLPGLPAAVSGLGLAQIVLSTLDFVPHRELLPEVLLPQNREEYQELAAIFEEVAQSARRHGIQVHHYLSPADGRRQCPENVLRACFINAIGQVSPCVFTNLPVRDVSHVTHAVESPHVNLIFGNINLTSLDAVWQSTAYRAFRRSHSQGELPSVCRSCGRVRAPV